MFGPHLPQAHVLVRLWPRGAAILYSIFTTPHNRTRGVYDITEFVHSHPGGSQKIMLAGMQARACLRTHARAQNYHTHTHTHTHTHAHAHTHTHTHTFSLSQTHTRTHTHRHTHKRTTAHVHTCTRARADTHAHTHAHTPT
jgi:hypothetical protein